MVHSVKGVEKSNQMINGKNAHLANMEMVGDLEIRSFLIIEVWEGVENE